MKIISFLKSRFTVAIIIRRLFLFCFQKDRGQRLWPQHLEAEACALEACVRPVWPALKEHSPPWEDNGPASAVCRMQWPLHSFSVFFPREGKVHYSLFVGETSNAQMWEKEHPCQRRTQVGVLRIAWLIRAQRWSRVHVLWNGNPVLSGWAKISGTQNCRQVLFYSFVSFQLISDLWLNKYTHESYRLCRICLQA